MDQFWQGRRVLVTGHTGFKGAWLCLWQERLGAHVSAFNLPATTTPSLHALLAPWNQDHHLRDGVRAAVAAARPEIVLPHPKEAARLTQDSTLARQSLGWRSRLGFDDTLRWTADWYAAWRGGAELLGLSRAQLAAFTDV